MKTSERKPSKKSRQVTFTLPSFAYGKLLKDWLPSPKQITSNVASVLLLLAMATFFLPGKTRGISQIINFAAWCSGARDVLAGDAADEGGKNLRERVRAWVESGRTIAELVNPECFDDSCGETAPLAENEPLPSREAPRTFFRRRLRRN